MPAKKPRVLVLTEEERDAIEFHMFCLKETVTDTAHQRTLEWGSGGWWSTALPRMQADGEYYGACFSCGNTYPDLRHILNHQSRECNRYVGGCHNGKITPATSDKWILKLLRWGCLPARYWNFRDGSERHRKAVVQIRYGKDMFGDAWSELWPRNS